MQDADMQANMSYDEGKVQDLAHQALRDRFAQWPMSSGGANQPHIFNGLPQPSDYKNLDNQQLSVMINQMKDNYL